MGVEFRLLGEVEVHVDGVRLDIGHARQCCVLACLVVDVNRPVPVDVLIDRVWAHDPPHRARNAAAAYVSRLRQSLAPVTGVTISRGAVGYQLNADAESVDVHAFRALASRARAQPDPNAASETFDDALATFRGEPLNGLDTPWIAEVRAALETERLSVLLDRNDAALLAGRHTELVSELAAAAALHPLDERLAGQLMLAQARSGRQADALETFRRMRERLVDELGLDPGRDLQAVHREVLDGASGPVPRPSRQLMPERPTGRPRLALRRMTRFVGRDEELGRVADALEPGAALTLTGVGGVGKTRLAIEACDRMADEYADGVWSCELAPVGDGAAVSHAVAVALGLSLGQDGDPAAAIIAHLAGRRSMLVVDNCEHVLADAATLVDRITRECPEVTVLATSREPLGIEAERLLPVAPLSEVDATHLFAERARSVRPDFDLRHEPVGAVAEICRRLDGLPLAIELAAARLRMMSSLDVARRLDRLRLLSGGARGAHPRQQSVTATIDWSYRLLAEPEQALFARMSVFAGSFDVEAAHAVCAEPSHDEDDTLDLLTGLVDKSMVTVRAGASATRFALLETLRAYGRERLDEQGAGDVYADRHARYFTDLLERGAVAMHGPDEGLWITRMAPTAGTTFTSPDFDNVRAAFERAMSDDDVGLALRLVASLAELMHMRIGYTSMGWVERAVDAGDPDHPAFAGAVGVAARGAWVLGRFAHAEALAAKADGCTPTRGHSYLSYPGDITIDCAPLRGAPARAAAYYEAALGPARKDGYPSRLVWLLYNATVAYDVLGSPEAGLPLAEEAMAVAEPTANPSTRAMARCALGRALKLVDPRRALAVLDEALRLAEPVQNNWMTGIARMETLAVQAVDGDPATVAQGYLDVLQHWSQAGPGAGVQHWYSLRFIARFMHRLGATEEAEALAAAFAAAGREPAGNGATQQALNGQQALALATSWLHAQLG